MYDYSLNDDDRKLYILKHKIVKDKDGNKIEVYYADGSMDIVDDLDDNLDIIEGKKDEQIEDALSFSRRVVNKINKGIAKGMALSSTVCIGGSIVAANLPVDNEAKVIAIAGLGVIYLGSIVNAIRMNRPKKELEKLSYLDSNRENLELYSEYNNSLNGIDNRVKHQIRSRENPYSSLYVEDYDINTLKTINDNINRAKHFKYVEKKKR